MSKIVYVHENGRQKLTTVGVNGKVVAAAKILWDERVDGPLDPAVEAKLGGLSRDKDNALVVDDAKAAEQAALDQAEKDSEKQERDALKKARQELKALDFSVAMSEPEVRKALKNIVKLLKGLL